EKCADTEAPPESRHGNERAQGRRALLLREVQTKEHGIARHVGGEYVAEGEEADRIDAARRPGQGEEHDVASMPFSPRVAGRSLVHGRSPLPPTEWAVEPLGIPLPPDMIGCPRGSFEFVILMGPGRRKHP